MRLLEGDDSDSPGRNKSRQYFEGAGLSETNHSPDHKSDHMDVRPKEDYDEPWEWSAKQSLIIQSHIETGNIPPHFLTNQSQQANRTPQLSKRTVAASSQGGGDGAAASPDQEDRELEPGAPKDKMDVAEDAHYEVTTRPPDDPGEDNEGYTHLREEFGTIGPTPPDSLTRNSTTASATSSSAQQEKQQSKEDSSKVGNYEEPWDLQSKQRELEEKMKAASDRASKGGGGVDTGSPPHNADPRAQEGYEKPWDWKPDKKDDRTLEGMALISPHLTLGFRNNIVSCVVVVSYTSHT